MGPITTGTVHKNARLVAAISVKAQLSGFVARVLRSSQRFPALVLEPVCDHLLELVDDGALATTELLMPLLGIIQLDVRDVVPYRQWSALTILIRHVDFLTRHPYQGVTLFHALLPN